MERNERVDREDAIKGVKGRLPAIHDHISEEIIMAVPSQTVAAQLARDTDQAPQIGKYLNSITRLLLPTVFVLLVILAVIKGWAIRGEQYLTAESGLGYALGIIGGLLMLSQILYTFRKKISFMRTWGKVSVWLKYHLAVGLIAPVVILYHANFGLGSANSNFALGAMALVVSSGIIGRYIYAKINQRLYGRIATLEDLKAATDTAKQDVGRDIVMDEDIAEMLHSYEQQIMMADRSWSHIFPHLLLLGIRARFTRWRLEFKLGRSLRLRARQEGWDKHRHHVYKVAGKEHIRVYVRNVRKVAEYLVYRRIFSLWHVLHIPLFMMLVISGIVHVVAVHLY